MITYMHIPASLSFAPTIGQCTLDDSYNLIRQVVGGYLELIQLEHGDMYINEEGKIEGLPVNARASQLAWRCGAIEEDDCVVGNAILFGKVDAEGNETSITSELRAWCLQQLGAHA